MLALFGVRAQEFLAAAHGRRKRLELPPQMLLGAIRSIVSQQLRTHSEDRMGLLVDDVMAWIESYSVPAGEQGWTTGQEHFSVKVARQWLAATAPAPAPARLPRGRHRLPQAAVERSQRTRIIHGTAEVMVAKGYAAATVADIVSAAGVRRDVFSGISRISTRRISPPRSTARRACSRRAPPRTSPDRAGPSVCGWRCRCSSSRSRGTPR